MDRTQDGSDRADPYDNGYHFSADNGWTTQTSIVFLEFHCKLQFNAASDLTAVDSLWWWSVQQPLQALVPCLQMCFGDLKPSASGVYHWILLYLALSQVCSASSTEHVLIECSLFRSRPAVALYQQLRTSNPSKNLKGTTPPTHTHCLVSGLFVLFFCCFFYPHRRHVSATSAFSSGTTQHQHMDRRQQENSLSDAFGSIWQLGTQEPPALQLNSPFHVAVKHSSSFPFFKKKTDPRLALSLTWGIADFCELLFEHSQLQAGQGNIHLLSVTPRKSFNSDFWGCLMPFVP